MTSDSAHPDRDLLLRLDAEVSRALVEARPLKENLQSALEVLVRLLDVAFARVWTLNEEEQVLDLEASAGLYTHVTGGHARIPVGAFKIGRIAASRTAHLTNNVVEDPEVSDPEWARREGMIAFAGYPLVLDQKLVGVLAMFSRSTLASTTLLALETIARGVAQTIDRRRAEAKLLARELWLSTTLASIGDGVIATDAQGRVTYVNAVAEALTGFPTDEATGKLLKDIFPIFNQTTHAVVENPVERALREGHVVGLANHTVLRHRDGHYTAIEDSAAPIREAGGPIRGVVLVFRDATNARRSEALQAEALDEAQRARRHSDEARLRSEFLFDVAGVLAEGLDLSSAMQRLVDILTKERVQFASISLAEHETRIRHLVHAPFDEEVVALNAKHQDEIQSSASYPPRRALLSGRTVTTANLSRAPADAVTTPFVRFAQARAFEHAAFIPITRGKEVKGVLTVASRSETPFSPEDITMLEAIAKQAAMAIENAQLFAETERLRAVAEQATLAKDRFLAHVSHDLRNPVGSILGWASLLQKREPTPAQLTKGLQIIERNAQAQVQLIEDLLDVSRIASGKLNLSIGMHDVAKAMETALDPARLAAEGKKVQLAVHLDPDVGSITVDADRFRQVIWNLVSNAVKFTPPGGSVEVTAHREASQLRIVVSDTGKGIPLDFLPRIFNRFEQVEAGAKRQQGLGLGLAIVRHIVELHGGTIRAESEGVGKGSRFVACFPIGAAVRSSDSFPPLDAKKATAILEGVRALCVDDEEDARDVVATILEQAGATVTRASSADEAFALFREQVTDILISDVQMPRRDGRSLLRQIRSLQEQDGGRVAAVALTAMSRAEDRIQSLAAGFNTHVTKPIDPSELVLVVAGLLGRSVPDEARVFD